MRSSSRSADKLTIRDLGSSNGTFVNGKKVAGQQVLKPGDELTVGAVTLRVAKLGQAGSPLPASPASKPKAGDTAVLEAIAAEPERDEEEFEMEFDDGDPEPEVEGIPLADDETAKPAKPKPAAKAAATAAATPASGSACCESRASQRGRRGRPVPPRPQARRRGMIVCADRSHPLVHAHDPSHGGIDGIALSHAHTRRCVAPILLDNALKTMCRMDLRKRSLCSTVGFCEVHRLFNSYFAIFAAFFVELWQLCRHSH